MSARKFIVNSLLLIVYCFLLLTVISYLLTMPVFAKHPVGQTGQYCDGNKIFIDNADGSHSGGIDCGSQGQICKEDEDDDGYFAKCVDPKVAPAPNPPAGTTPISANWQASEQSAFTGLNIVTDLGPCLITGSSLIKPKEELPANEKDEHKCPEYSLATGKLALFDQTPSGGALGGVSNLVLAMYSAPPLSSGEYLASVGENLGVVKPAYAQLGTGSSSGDAVIKPILKLWELSRNLSYMAFILVFVAIGFMIMLRSRINPQTVVTAQAALPGLVIGLILVTFSYFVAALIVDLSFIGMNLVVFLFSSQSGISNAIQNPAEVGAAVSLFALFQNFVFNGAHINHLVGPVKDAFQSSVPFFQPSNLFGYVVGGPIGSSIGVLVMFIVLVAILIQMFKLLWALVGCYIAIFVTTIFGPFIILAASLPGRGGTLAVWWKSLLGNVLVFPAVFAAFLFAGVFLGSVNPGDFQQALPLFAGLPIDLLRVIIAYGIILGTPAIPGAVKKALGVPELADISQAALGGVRAGAGTAQAGYQAGTAGMAREAQEYYTQRTRAQISGEKATETFTKDAKPRQWWYRIPGLNRR